MPDVLRVFVDAKAVDVPPGSSALDAVRALDAALAAEVESGTRVITDSRGLPAPPDLPAHGGSIFRVVLKRDRAEPVADQD